MFEECKECSVFPLESRTMTCICVERIRSVYAYVQGMIKGIAAFMLYLAWCMCRWVESCLSLSLLFPNMVKLHSKYSKTVPLLLDFLDI